MFAHSKPTSIPLLVLLLLMPLFCCNCTYVAMRPGYQGPRPLPQTIKEEYAYPRYQGTYEEKVIEENNTYVLKEIQFKPTINLLPIIYDIRLDYYAVKNVPNAPVIIVLPILGGRGKVAHIFASYFAENGYSAVIVHNQKKHKKLKKLEQVNDTLKQMIFDHKQAIDWIEMQPNLDGNRIGALGVSMGGIKTSILSALDSRIKASVIALAGGDLPYILVHSTERGIVKARKKFMAQEHLTLAKLQAKLENDVHCDPIQYAQYLDARKVMMVLAIWDTTVPYEKGEALWRTMGKPETIYLFAGHYTAIPFIFYVRSMALDFFDRQLIVHHNQ